MVDLFAAGKRVAEVERLGAIVPLEKGAAVHGAESKRKRGVFEDGFVVAIGIEIDLLAGYPVVGLVADPVQEGLRLDELLVEGRAQVVEVESAEHTVPIGAIALPHVEQLLGARQPRIRSARSASSFRLTRSIFF